MSALISLFLKLSVFSLFAFGGINALFPALFELSVHQEHWLDQQTFADFFAIAQAAPGPNMMTVTLIGWHVSGIAGALMATFAISWPSSILIFYLQRYIMNMADAKKQQVVRFAASAIAVGLVLSSAWQICTQINHGVATYLMTILTIGTAYFTRWHPLYLIAVGATIGLMGLI